MRYLSALLLLLIVALPAYSHDGYTNWENKAGRGCCNNHDCQPISDENVKYLSDHVEVKINDRQWCEIKPQHYLRQGNAPDWSTAHICLERTLLGGSTAPVTCASVICFQPKPQF